MFEQQMQQQGGMGMRLPMSLFIFKVKFIDFLFRRSTSKNANLARRHCLSWPTSFNATTFTNSVYINFFKFIIF
jgi:hypothetical protein